ncbi:hypothetical protein T265_06613 [Opisthorchis viverrini]|uniref:Uncharacterized protein n=1 Tax=Opisthorchis viverrini TaxID=6198 RepID=A0A074ZFR5_OPIVI|nr:hypothetical protein T265_06613 [Opisthorchis viverrini]KER26033.1 hypothetical protein T265_06613 [Opisthorchis viverrini]
MTECETVVGAASGFRLMLTGLEEKSCVGQTVFWQAGYMLQPAQPMEREKFISRGASVVQPPPSEN